MDILGKNVVQFGCVLSELIRSCYESQESDEVRIFFGVSEVHFILKVLLTPQSIYNVPLHLMEILRIFSPLFSKCRLERIEHHLFPTQVRKSVVAT